MYLFWLLFSRPLQQIRNYNNNNNNYIETKNEKPKKKIWYQLYRKSYIVKTYSAALWLR